MHVEIHGLNTNSLLPLRSGSCSDPPELHQCFLPHVGEFPVTTAHVEDNPLDSFDPLYLGFFNIWRNVSKKLALNFGQRLASLLITSKRGYNASNNKL